MKLSVVVNTKNSGQYLQQCLGSVKKIADEIVVVDMASEDKTLAIAAKFGARIFQYPKPDVGFADPAREFAFSKARGEWLLLLDSDEELKSELARLIRQVVEGKTTKIPEAEAYFLARRNIIFDKPLEKAGWYPDYQLKLWRSGAIKWRPQVHSVPKILGTVAHFPAVPVELAVVHHNYQRVEQFLERANKYTTFEAEAKLKQAPNLTVRPEDLWQSFFDELWRRGFLEEGLLEGNHGVSLSLLQASNELAALMKVWQAEGFSWRDLSRVELARLRRRFLREAHYWWADLMVKKSGGLGRLYYRVRRKLKF